jgi:hypothetical protein
VEDLVDGDVYNGFIVALPKNQRLMHCIHAIVENVKNRTYGSTWLDPTGPGLFGKIFKPTQGLKIRINIVNDEPPAKEKKTKLRKKEIFVSHNYYNQSVIKCA